MTVKSARNSLSTASASPTSTLWKTTPNSSGDPNDVGPYRVVVLLSPSALEVDVGCTGGHRFRIRYRSCGFPSLRGTHVDTLDWCNLLRFCKGDCGRRHLWAVRAERAMLADVVPMCICIAKESASPGRLTSKNMNVPYFAACIRSRRCVPIRKAKSSAKKRAKTAIIASAGAHCWSRDVVSACASSVSLDARIAAMCRADTLS